MDTLLIGVVCAIFGAVATAVLGAILSKERLYAFFTKIRGKIFGTIDAPYRNQTFKDIYDALIKQYDERDLFLCKLPDHEKIIPFLVKEGWTDLRYNCLEDQDIILFQRNADMDTFKVDDKMIERRKRLSQKLVDSPSLYLKSISRENGKFRFHVSSCRYFQRLTVFGGVDDETHAKLMNGKKTPKRDRVIPYIDLISTTGQKFTSNIKLPITIGCHVAFVLTLNDVPTFMMHRRSKGTNSHGGQMALLPVYGMAPAINNAENVRNLLKLNLISKYLEEMHGEKNIQTPIESNIADPEWFYENEKAAFLLELFDKQKASLECLGFGFDCLNAGLNLALLVYVKDPEASRRIHREIRSNKDVESPNPIPYNDSRFGKWLENGEFSTPSAFASSLAHKRITEILNTADK